MSAAEALVVRTDLAPQIDSAALSVGKFATGWRPSPAPGGFSSLLDDGNETTLVCSDTEMSAYAGDAIALDAGWQRITFAGPLPWEMVGFLADVATRLAQAHVPFTSVSGFTTDHVLVRAASIPLAGHVLSGGFPPPQRPGTNP